MLNITHVFLFAGIFAILIFVAIWQFYLRNGDYRGDFVKAEISGKVFRLEVVKTMAERNQGLMNREKLKSDEGMLFVFPSMGIYPFWMKDTLIPLDIIWINNKKEVVYIKESAQPCIGLVETCKSIVPGRIAKYVIELNAAKVGEIGLKIGDSINF